MSQRAATSNRRSSLTLPDNRWLFAAFLLAVVVSAALLFLPLVEGSERSVVSTPTEAGQPAGPVATTEVRESLIEAEGWGVAVVLLIPVVVTAAPLVTPRRARRPVAIAAAAVLGVGVLIGVASVGLFYLPSAVLLAVGAARQRA